MGFRGRESATHYAQRYFWRAPGRSQDGYVGQVRKFIAMRDGRTPQPSRRRARSDGYAAPGRSTGLATSSNARWSASRILSVTASEVALPLKKRLAVLRLIPQASARLSML